MMEDFFEDLGRRISSAASDLSRKTADTIEVQKLKSNIRSLNRSSERDYIDIGKAVYDKYVKGEVVDGDVCDLCEAIEKRDGEIKGIQAEIAKIQGAV